MQPAPSSITIPGTRISNYRNSARRAIALIGLGAAASALVSSVGRRGLVNVATTTSGGAIDWSAVAGTVPDRDLNMIVIVCGEGDERLFRPGPRRPDVLVTFVLLRKGNIPPIRENDFAPDLERARAFSDLFVTTSDPDYISELVDNLAS
jgi:hypothetical protein